MIFGKLGKSAVKTAISLDWVYGDERRRKYVWQFQNISTYYTVRLCLDGRLAASKHMFVYNILLSSCFRLVSWIHVNSDNGIKLLVISEACSLNKYLARRRAVKCSYQPVVTLLRYVDTQCAVYHTYLFIGLFFLHQFSLHLGHQYSLLLSEKKSNIIFNKHINNRNMWARITQSV